MSAEGNVDGDSRATPALRGASASDPTVDVSVILVSYNTKALLQPCMERLESAIAKLTAQVFVVDNASRDGSAQYLRERYGHHEILTNAVNVGFGRANNQVLAHARGRYVLLLNTDAYVEPDALTRSIAYMDQHADCGVLGARLVGEDGHLQPSCRRFPTPWNVFLLRTGLNRYFPRAAMVDDARRDPAVVQPCDWVPGCYYLVRRTVIDAVGLFDPRFFLYYEEVDHCAAVKKAGWSVIYFPEVTVVHLGGESAKSDADLTTQGRQISVLQAESELLFFRKHHGLLGAWLSLLLTGLADAFLALKGLARGSGRRSFALARDDLRLAARVFIATRVGRRATR